MTNSVNKMKLLPLYNATDSLAKRGSNGKIPLPGMEYEKLKSTIVKD